MNLVLLEQPSVSQSDTVSADLPWENFHFGPDLTCDQNSALKDLLQRYQGCIALPPSNIGCTSLVRHKIDTGNSTASQSSMVTRCLISMTHWTSFRELSISTLDPLLEHWQVPVDPEDAEKKAFVPGRTFPVYKNALWSL